MSADVVNFTPQGRTIWVCNCGCSTFHLFSDGVAECSVCELPVTGAVDGWQEVTERADRRAEPLTMLSNHQGNGSEDFARALISKTASGPDAKLVITATGDSRTRIWADAETEAEVKWTKDRIQDAIGLLDQWREAQED